MTKYDEYLKLARDPEVIAQVLRSRMARLQEIELRFNSQIDALRKKLTLVDTCVEILPFITNGVGLCNELQDVLDLRNVYRKALKTKIAELEQERDNELALNT